MWRLPLFAYSVLGVLAMMFAADYDCARVGRQWAITGWSRPGNGRCKGGAWPVDSPHTAVGQEESMATFAIKDVAIVLNPGDDVAIAKKEIPAGSVIEDTSGRIEVRQDI